MHLKGPPRLSAVEHGGTAKERSVTMAVAATYKRIAWEARFNKPTASQLRMDLPAAAAKHMDRVCRSLLRMDGVIEQFCWYGECWRWSIEYRTKLSAEPLAVVIPSPDDLRLAIPVAGEFLRTLSQSRLPRVVRDGLDMARESFDSRWGLWSLDSAVIIDGLIDLIESKRRHLAKQAG